MLTSRNGVFALIDIDILIIFLVPVEDWSNIVIVVIIGPLMYRSIWKVSLESTSSKGKVILLISMILWFLASYKPHNQKQWGIQKTENIEQSYAGKLGKTIEPVIRPLGFNWKIGIALVTSFAAREVFVGTLATIYSVEADDEDTSTIKQKMASEINPDTSRKRFNFAVGMSLMIFYAFAMQCMATLAIVKRETKSWKWPLIQLFGMGLLAYVSALITYQILN